MALFALLAAFTFDSIRREEARRIAHSRAETVFELVQDKGPDRPTETPGLAAWLHLELKKYQRRLAQGDPARARLYGEIAETRGDGQVPAFLNGLREVLVRSPQPAPDPETLRQVGTPHALHFRSQSDWELAGRRFVVTRRKALDGGSAEGAGSDRFLQGAAAHLLDLSARLPPLRPARVLRLYAVNEDGTLLSLPLGTTAQAESREFRKLPDLPNFVPYEFLFRFDSRSPSPAGQAAYSGLYLDLGGQGLVATLFAPAGTADWAGVVAADLKLDLDWADFAAGIEPPLLATVVDRLGALAERVLPWSELEQALPARTSPELAAAVRALAERDRREGREASPFYLYHGIVEGRGAVAALQVESSKWLLILFPEARAGFARLPAVLLALLAVLLLAGFEISRRRAERALAEKQNLLNTMQVPLIVVDPNSDEVVFGNRAAEDLGIRPGSRMGDRVAELPEAREHYQRMQSTGLGVRRAYGVPLQVEDQVRYAIVRSVAVTAPIEALQANERHRLGVLFLVEPEADLALWDRERVRNTRDEERRLLSGLLTHGVDTLARVLSHLLQRDSAKDTLFVAWLAEYLERRVAATAWLLEHWNAAPPLPPDNAVEAVQARGTIARFTAIFEEVEQDAELRARLHWDNGALSVPGEPMRIEIDWPESFWFACPLRGGFGFFLGEVLVNAVRHGRPGTRPRLSIALDRVRRELVFEVENERASEGEPGSRKKYGGLQILERLARLFEWNDLSFVPAEGTFRVSWRVPVSERGAAGAAD